MFSQLLQMDPKTIFQLYFWGNIFICIVIYSFYFSYATNENKITLKWFGLSKLLLSTGWVLFLFRGIISDLLSINLANIIFFSACYFESVTILKMLRKPSENLRKLQLSLVVTSCLIFNFITLTGANINTRTLMVSIAMSIMFLIPSVKFISEKGNNVFRRIYAMAYITFSILILCRGIHVFLNPRNQLMAAEPFDIFYYLNLFLLTLVGTLGFLLLVKEKQDKQIQKLLNAKDQFFSIIAHDLRGPLGSALGISEILAENAVNFSPDEVQNFAQMLYKANQNSYKLLINLLDWSRIQTGLIEFNPEKLLLDQVIKENVELNKQTALNKEITLNYHCHEPIELTADKNMVDTIMRNLITNAIKFTERKGSVTIEALKNDQIIEIAFIDTGVGMEENIRKKLFKINEKTSKNGTENEVGTGLGLLLCSEFVSKHNGKIWVESELGKGSTFKITLPLN